MPERNVGHIFAYVLLRQYAIFFFTSILQFRKPVTMCVTILIMSYYTVTTKKAQNKAHKSYEQMKFTHKHSRNYAMQQNEI